MRYLFFASVGLAVVVAALPRSSGAEEAETDAFEVVVVRGSGVFLVSGTESGRIREVTLREDPYPPRPAPESAPERLRGNDGEITIAIYNKPGDHRYGYSYFDRHHVHHHRLHRKAFAAGKFPHRIHHANPRIHRPHHVGKGRARHGRPGRSWGGRW